MQDFKHNENFVDEKITSYDLELRTSANYTIFIVVVLLYLVILVRGFLTYTTMHIGQILKLWVVATLLYLCLFPQQHTFGGS
jgi:hypothetical protein